MKIKCPTCGSTDFGRLLSGGVYPGDEEWSMNGRVMAVWTLGDRTEHQVMLGYRNTSRDTLELTVRHIA